MASDFLASIKLDGLSTNKIWAALDRDTRRQAAEALYKTEKDKREVLASADKAIADAIRFRLASVRKLTADKKAGYLASGVRPDEALATLLLQALHLEHHRPLLTAFLDALKIPHEDGHIKDDAELEPADSAALQKAVDAIDKGFDAATVDRYLASLLAMDDELWGGLRDVLAARRDA